MKKKQQMELVFSPHGFYVSPLMAIFVEHGIYVKKSIR
jgi:hypothetical protein